MKTSNAIVVLDDCETFANLDGCNIIFLTTEGFDSVDNLDSVKDLKVTDIEYKISLKEIVELFIENKKKISEKLHSML